ncbi:MAG: hypothetical protein WD066_10525 [Planctomycetaceae bacterium]
MAIFSFLDHLNLIEDDSSRYEIGVSDRGFSYLDLMSEKKARQLTFEEKKERQTGAALDGSTRARGQSNVRKVETVDHDEVCLDTDLLAIVRDVARRRQRASLFPWTVGICGGVILAWLLLLANADYPFLAFVLSAIIVVPAVAFALVNTWHLDRSRKDVHLSYKIEGKGAIAFSRLNSALERISKSGQTLLFAGRRHFEDSRYTGGAANLPELKDIMCGRGRPPLLELDFDVWHVRAFNKDLFFMPDHVLIYDGARMGGVSYGNIAIATRTEVTQGRNRARPTADAVVVGRTYRFVNNDGSPDRRFNNNCEIPLIEYGVLEISGSGLDICLFVTNQQAAFGSPEGFNAIQDLARKPIRQVSDERRSQASLRRREEVFCVLLDALNCVAFSDGRASAVEQAKLRELMKRLGSPWEDAEVDRRSREFGDRARSQGLKTVLGEVCSRLSLIREGRQREILVKCLDQLIAADGSIHRNEAAIKQRIVKALQQQ